MMLLTIMKENSTQLKRLVKKSFKNGKNDLRTFISWTMLEANVSRNSNKK